MARLPSAPRLAGFRTPPTIKIQATCRELPPLPAKVPAHTLRRTYISMMFAAGAELPYVTAQVGHDDSKGTLEIYARVLKRRDRNQVGLAFD